MKRTIPLILCVCLSPLASVTLAQQVSQPSFTNDDISTFHGNNNTLVNAIAVIEQSTGGKVIDIRFSNTNNMPGYNVVLVKAAQVQFFHFEERSKHVVELDASSKPIYMLNWRGKADVHFAQQARCRCRRPFRRLSNRSPDRPWPRASHTAPVIRTATFMRTMCY